LQRPTQYIDAHMEIYSPSVTGKLISLTGHSGIGKTFFLRKLTCEYAKHVNNSYRFLLYMSCGNSEWHAFEDKFTSHQEGKIGEMLQLFLNIASPSFPNSEQLQ
ncbi:hypothetical protein, partial [Salmonella sp. s51228]|uniref:hypothetical protein n=1 Tax=Salmonella sp. s51228 TaxID=3159652 RepID=UPI00397F6037